MTSSHPLWFSETFEAEDGVEVFINMCQVQVDEKFFILYPSQIMEAHEGRTDDLFPSFRLNKHPSRAMIEGTVCSEWALAL